MPCGGFAPNPRAWWKHRRDTSRSKKRRFVATNAFRADQRPAYAARSSPGYGVGRSGSNGAGGDSTLAATSATHRYTAGISRCVGRYGNHSAARMDSFRCKSRRDSRCCPTAKTFDFGRSIKRTHFAGFLVKPVDRPSGESTDVLSRADPGESDLSAAGGHGGSVRWFVAG